MCDRCVIDSVKDKMLSRRNFLRGGATAGLAAVAVAGGAPLALAQRAAGSGGVAGMTIADLTHELYPEFPTFFGVPGFSMEQSFKFDENGFNLFVLNVNEHTGTHIDAPLHFSADCQAVNAIPVENLMAPLAVVDISAKAEDDDDAQLTPDDLTAWIDTNGPLPERCCVAMQSGWGRHLGTDKFRNADADGVMHFPGFHEDATAMLLEESSAVGIAVDTLSLDFGRSADFKTHYAWLPTNRWGLENVANLETLPATGATIIVGAPKHRGGSGGPTRVFALL
jgi:kynurenine formamidase